MSVVVDLLGRIGVDGRNCHVYIETDVVGGTGYPEDVLSSNRRPRFMNIEDDVPFHECIRLMDLNGIGPKVYDESRRRGEHGGMTPCLLSS